jgi:hypothetical protein
MQTLRVCAHRFYTKAEAEAVIANCFDRDPALAIKEAPGVLMSTTKHGRELAASKDYPFQGEITVPTAPFAQLPDENTEWSAEDILRREG